MNIVSINAALQVTDKASKIFNDIVLKIKDETEIALAKIDSI